MNAAEITSKKRIWGNIWLGFFVVFFLFMFSFTLIACLMQPLWYDINEFLIGMIGVGINWLVMIIVLSFLLLGYSLYLVIFHLATIIKKKFVKPHLANKIIPFPFFVIWIAMLALLIMEAGEELTIVRVQLEYISPILWLLAILLAGSLLLFIIPQIANDFVKKKEQLNSEEIEKKPRLTKKQILTISYIVFFTVLLVLPFIIIPSSVYKNNLPNKPLLVAHRGASHLAPENTIAAGEIAVKWHAVGWEVDVAISYDGIPFIVHDDTFRRTTNIDQIFPNRINDQVSSFNLSDILLLDAGSWFVEQDPFKTIQDGFVTQSEATSFLGEKIPTLDEVIHLTRDNNLLLDIDYRRPPSDHPYYNSYFDILLEQLNGSGLGKNILISSFLPMAENLTHVCGALSVDELLSLGCELVNTQHGLTNKIFKEYETNGIATMVWTVDSKSRFSQLWCLGVDYVKTNSLHLLIPMTQPGWSLIKSTYLIIWTIVIVAIPGAYITGGLIRYRKKK
ncbi:MAG: glycerophosphodiester phosphodiesterase family protein [Candidatus Thorarchaeota archaeon]